MSPKFYICVFLIMAGTTAAFAWSLSSGDTPEQPMKDTTHAGESRGNTSQDKEIEKTGVGEIHRSAIKVRDKNINKRVDPGTVIAGIALGVGVLKDVLNAIGNVNRKIVIGIDNESEDMWKAQNVYFSSGTSDVTMPYKVKSGEALLYGARKTSGTARGAVGAMAYYIKNLGKTLVVMFSVPFDYNLYSNWWNVKLYDGKVKADYDKYDALYEGNKPFEGDNSWHKKSIGNGLQVRGVMNSSGKATLLLRVKKKLE